MNRRAAVAAAALATLALAASDLASESVDLAACEDRLRAAPEDEAGPRCFYELWRSGASRAKVERRLAELLARDPGNAWLTYYLGSVYWSEPPRAEALYRRALSAFAARGEARGEVLTRSNLHQFLSDRGEVEEAAHQLERAVAVAEASGDPALQARARMLEARHLWSSGQDLERAYLSLRRVEEAVFPGGSYAFQRDWLIGFGNVCLDLGRARQAQQSFRRLRELSRAAGDRFAEANAAYNLAHSLVGEVAEEPGEPGALDEAVGLLEEAAAAARASGHRGVEANAHGALGLLATGGRAREHFAACLAAAPAARARGFCWSGLARHLAGERPAEAEAAIEEASRWARAAGDPSLEALCWRDRMRVAWALAPPEQALAESRAALEAIEALRDLQEGATSRAGLFASWSDEYRWLAGRLLQAAEEGRSRAALEAAFEVGERSRARSLIDALEAARAAPSAPPPALGKLQEERAALIEELARLQRRLLAAELPAAERARAERERDRLELREQELAGEVARASPAFAALRRPRFATLTQVERALAPAEAFLSFQIAPWVDWTGDFGGGAWVLVTTRDGTRALALDQRLAERRELRRALALLGGLIARRDGAEAAAVEALRRALLDEALAGLPPAVERLVIAPDDALHRLPFARLLERAGRARSEGVDGGARYALTLVPSATLWLGWREERAAPAEVPLLVLADPPLPAAEGAVGEAPAPALADPRLAAAQPPRPARPAAAAEGGAPEGTGDGALAAPPRFPPLPYARREGRTAVGHLGGGSVLRLGEEASEVFLKGADLRRFGILHLAAHAVIDEAEPARSGVLLAPGAAAEDGFLQPREIVGLDLAGRVVVLSSCRSASGEILRGEGVMGLARAFFQAGASAVVASLWPLRDDEGAAFFDRFYRRVGRGESLAEALRGAQLDRVGEGAPAFAWAGMVVLGDGDRVVLPAGARRAGGGRRLVALAALVLAALAPPAVVLALAARRRRRRRLLGRASGADSAEAPGGDHRPSL